ncbi:methyl-accepting chemotaxis protein [Paenibacillus lemnae]|uniref:Chemotaxis protein n=1 Tax=Paenibacillus lemnae TaxID=1330551 RepID=A0A848M5H7_PAELE|nr:methyl-accepting chemotaxis protein [Paenibacillus lemnae]NMO95480.1 chemotaxis protein [Paenibacillus lemnae]
MTLLLAKPKKTLEDLPSKQQGNLKTWRQVPAIGDRETCLQVMHLFEQHPEVPCMVVCHENGQPKSLIMRDSFHRLMSGRFAREIFDQRPAAGAADKHPMIVDALQSWSHILNQALERPESDFYDCIVVIGEDQLLGVLTVRDLLQHASEIQKQTESRREEMITDSKRHTMSIETSLGEVKYAAGMTREKSEDMQKWSVSGRENLEQVQAACRNLMNEMEKHAAFARQLLTHTDGISGITDQISELANQSSLLALNASIEAAHAGEHGRGFQVVAGEVQSMARQTRELSGRIASMLAQISHLVTDTAKAAVSSLQEINNCETLISAGSSSFVQMERASVEVREAGSEVYELTEKATAVIHRIQNELSSIQRAAKADIPT